MSPDDRATFERLGQRLRDLRAARGLTQADVAQRAGFTGKYLSEIERGTRDIPLSTLLSLVERGLGVDLADAFVVGDKRPSKTARRTSPRDVDAVAEQILALPPAIRRKLLDLVQTIRRTTRPK